MTHGKRVNFKVDSDPCHTCGRWSSPILEWLSEQTRPSKYVAVTRVPPFSIVDHDDNLDALLERTDVAALYYHMRP